MDFIEKIKRNQLLYYIGKCIKNIGNKEFRAKVLDLDTTPRMVMFHHNGDAYPGRIIYYFKTGGPAGFFGIFRGVLGALNYADQLGMLPVVEWTRSTPYCDESMDSVTMNPFEYYFKQPAGIALSEISQASNLVIGKISDGSFRRSSFSYGKYDESVGHAGYVWDCERFKELAVIMKKYIRLTDEVQKQMVADIDKLRITDRTLGVQVRRIVFQYGVKDHPMPVDLNDYILAIDKLMSKGGYDQIFLATEEEETLTAILERFGEKVVYYGDVIRNNIGDTFYSVTSNRPHHYFLLGYEVLRDACTLAMCKSLVAGMSNVSMHAKIMKLSMDSDYTEEIILNNGIVKNGMSTKQVSKKVHHLGSLKPERR